MKTVRFSLVVAKCGRPGVHLTWVAPERDRALMGALKENRVMTVHHLPRGTAKDYGTVGLIRGAGGQLLVFPKSLRRFSERRVVGINYNLLASPGEVSSTPDRLKPELSPQRPNRPAAVKAAAKPRPSAAKDAEDSPAEETTSTRRAPPPAKKEAPAPPPLRLLEEPEPPLTWSVALNEVEKARRESKSRSTAAYARLTALAERIRERLKPH